jgi:ATP-dependent helicase/nuclease subunit B
VTAITRLIRDPYAIYARYVLRLKPLDPLVPEPDARLRGKVLHEIVEAFVRGRPADEAPDAARARLLALAEDKLAADIAWPSAQRLWLARIARIADRFVAAEARRAAEGRAVILEEGGRIALPALDFTLTARPDRIDLLADGRLHIYDYKSGAPPTPKEQRHFEKQLLLEAAMAERGAFPAIGRREVAAVTYIQLGGEAKEVTTLRDLGDFDAHWHGLARLIGHYLRPANGYPSRRAVFETRRAGDYDHLARFGEWDLADPPAPEDVA